MTLTHTFEWINPSSDPNDETFADAISRVTLEGTPVSADSAGPEDAGACDAVLVGEPYDGAVIGRRGAREGPRGIRQSLAGVKTHHFELGSAGDDGFIGDVGDVDLLTGGTTADVSDVQQRVESVATSVYGCASGATNGRDGDGTVAGPRPVFLGGDNSLTVANVAPLLETGDDVGVVSFDAHLDCREPIDGGGPSSGTPYYQLHERGLDAFAVVGARHFETSRTYAAYVRDRGGEIITAEDVQTTPLETITERALEAMADVDRIFVSLDVDVLDAAAAPGVSAPTPGGVTSARLYPLLRRIVADERVAGFEVVECAPPLDEGTRTVDAAARAIAHVLARWSA